MDYSEGYLGYIPFYLIFHQYKFYQYMPCFKAYIPF